jgi:hypothetical protein
MKKHDADRLHDIFGSESMGVGQMHSQLVLCSSGLRGPGFAALSTLNAFRIFSNDDLTASVESL